MLNSLKPEEITRVRKTLGYSMNEFAVLLSVSFETVRAWESGKRGCKGPAALLIQMLDECDGVEDILKS